ncbi:MAG: MmcQ/YjbR family DNA-binding protein [Flavobacteriales bacterium]|nr:MmcQ/YjbR family DNA-binding protein [Flavobacteriales bacterium]
METTIESLRTVCLQFKGVTEDVKWGNDLCFCVGEKMFLVLGLDQVPTPASFKASSSGFDELINLEGIEPAPYLARYKWVKVDDITRFSVEKWKQHAKEAYDLVFEKLPKKIKLNIED